MDLEQLPTHITQSTAWGEFKTKMGTAAVRTGETQFTLHKIPAIPYYIGYCPKVNPTSINWEEIRQSGEAARCAAIRFDCPNIIKKHQGTKEEQLQKHCLKAAKSTFAKHTVFLDLTPNKDTLLSQMKTKTRYNTRYAQRHGVVVTEKTDEGGLRIFLKLQRETATRQKFLIHPDEYYRTLFDTLRPHGMVHILVAEHQTQPLAAYLLLSHQGVLYYPYGGSTTAKRNLFPSNLLMWEAILLGKHLNCRLMDMWGATTAKDDPWWGFTRFKLGYGGELVEFIDSYDLVINKPIYNAFNFAYGAFWKANEILRKIKN